MMDDADLLRFNRQILLPQIDIEGQQKLAQSKVTIIGLGGLGCPVTIYLAAAGIGELTLIDHDTVELSNLQRQPAYTESDIGEPKARVLSQFIARQNPKCKVNAITEQFELDKHQDLVSHSDVLIDATDNIDARKNINRVSLRFQKPLVYGAAIRMEGQLSVFDPRDDESPCYECVFSGVELNESCSESGVLGSVVGTIGLMQATETIKLLVNTGKVPVGRLLLYDALDSDWQAIKITKHPQCPACGQ